VLSLVRRRWETAAGALVATVFNWVGWQAVHPGLDPSWQAGLAVAFTRHLRWGPQVDFTYGPYGFAGFLEPFYRSTSTIALLYGLGVTWLLAVLLVTAFRRVLESDRRRGLLRRSALPLATLAAWAVVALSWEVARTADFATVVGLGLAVELLRTEPGRLDALMATALGALAAFGLLVKLNTGLVVLGLLVVCVAGRRPGARARLAATAGLSAVVTFAAAWAVAGQRPADLVSFFHVSAELVAGYSSAMGQALPRSSIAWWAVAVGVVVAVCLVAATRQPCRRRRAAALVMVAGWGWSVVKDGFVAGNHFPEFFRLLLVAAALSLLWAGRGLLSSAAVAAAAVAAAVVSGLPPIHPWPGPVAVAREVADVADGARFSHLVDGDRRRALAAEGISPRLLEAVGSRTVAIEPWEDMVAWADPRLRWDPEPVLQSYSAFTARLDRLDAAFLGSSRAPQEILYSPTGFDHRDAAWDPPATMEAIVCRYREVASAGPWRLLRRVPDRCGAPKAVGVVAARFGEPVPVPPVDGGAALVVGTFSLTTPLYTQAEGVLLKPPATWVTVWAGGDSHSYRLVTGTALDFHLLASPAGTGVDAAVNRLRVYGGGWRRGTGSVSIHFYAIPLDG
jgi:hypothetical protein